jgi:hypothetical protein
MGEQMHDRGEGLIRQLCDEIGPDARPFPDFSGRLMNGVTCWAIEVVLPTSFLQAAEVAARRGLGRACVERVEGGHRLYWPCLIPQNDSTANAETNAGLLAA